jgi:hypothetical protein
MLEDVLASYPNLPKNLRDWALCQIAISKFQLGENQAQRS